MADHIKRPVAPSLQKVARARAADATLLQGKSLPARVVRVVSSGIVTVAFEVNAGVLTLPTVTVPVEGPEYIRYPIQVGDLGRVTASDARLGGVTGLGAGTADLTQPANLAALSFVWLGNTGWTPAEDPNLLILNGPGGAKLRDKAATHYIQALSNKVDIDGNITVIGNRLGFFGSPAVVRQAVTGALSSVTDPAAKAVLTSLIHALGGAEYGLIQDSTT